MHATTFLFKGTVSFQFAAVRLLYVGKFCRILSATSFHKLFPRLYDKGHNGFTHSQCTSLQSKVWGTLYKKKWFLGMFFFFYLTNPQQGTVAWEGTFWNPFIDFLCIKRDLHTPRINFLSGKWKEDKFLIHSVLLNQKRTTERLCLMAWVCTFI